MKLIDISTRRHPNTFTMVDDADYDWLNQWKWCLKGVNGYVIRYESSNCGKLVYYMHREILKPPPGMLGDHRFGNKLDNRRENLRICTNAENVRNRSPKPGRSLPKGVYWNIRDRRFRAQIRVNGQRIGLGGFLTESEASEAYNAAAIKYHGEFARINQQEAQP